MSKVTTGSGQGKNQSAADLTIPTLGANPAPAARIVQPGEEDEATGAAAEAPAAAAPPAAAAAPLPAGLEAFIGDAPAQPKPAAAPIAAADDAAPVTRGELTSFMQRMEQMLLASQQAKNNPVMARHDRDQFAEVPPMTLDMPIEGDLSRMRRPDQRAEQVDIDVVRNMDQAEMLAFLNEPVTINISETNEVGAENPVALWVNGRSCVIPRGRDVTIRRYYVELLLRAKPEGVNTRITRDGDGNVKNHVDKTRALKYPFAIISDRNPRGLAWARKIRSEA